MAEGILSDDVGGVLGVEEEVVILVFVDAGNADVRELVLAGYLIHFFKMIFIRIVWDFPGGAVDRNPPVSAGDVGSIPGPGRFHMPRGMCATATEPKL